LFLPGSDKDECKLIPLLGFPLGIPGADSLLLVDENDIRELSSPMKKEIIESNSMEVFSNKPGLGRRFCEVLENCSLDGKDSCNLEFPL
jgi:hypothetical protein